MAKRRTEPAPVAPRAEIQKYCSVPKAIRAFSLIQERWVVFIVASLLQEALGCNELSRRASGVNPATMKQRLSLLEDEGVITKTVLSTMPPRTEYRLTEAGEGLRPAIEALARWGIDNYPDDDTQSTKARSRHKSRSS